MRGSLALALVFLAACGPKKPAVSAEPPPTEAQSIAEQEEMLRLLIEKTPPGPVREDLVLRARELAIKREAGDVVPTPRPGCEAVAQRVVLLLSPLGQEARFGVDDLPALIEGCSRVRNLASEPETVDCLMAAEPDSEPASDACDLDGLIKPWLEALEEVQE